MQTFKQLLDNNKSSFEHLDTDLLNLFQEHFNNEEIEDLDQYEVQDKLDYNGSLHSLVDGRIDVYNYDLRQWAVENYDYIDQALDEGIAGRGDNFHSLIQCGQYMYYTEQMNEELNSLINIINDLIDGQGE